MTLFTAICLVVANMVGTGVFTSLGFQVGDLPSGFVILLLWALGGVCALCGALCYAELAAALPCSGGEYHFIGRSLHPALGFLAGWLSATVGFSVPIALAAMALGEYASNSLWPGSGAVWTLPGVGFAIAPHQAVALGAVALATFVHSRGVAAGSRFQNIATLVKLALILIVIIAGFAMANAQQVGFLPGPGDGELIAKPAFAVSLVYVMYSYSGWNAATYITGELRCPARDVPIALLCGTAIVTVVYLALNAVFLRSTPMSALEGHTDVGLVAGTYIFGETGGRIVGGCICLGLIASISAMTWVGPRVAAAMGEDLKALAWLSKTSAAGAPGNALLVQFCIVVALLLTSVFSRVLVYIQFALTLSAALAVAGLIVLRVRQPDLPRPFRVPLYPATPLVFLAISGWMLWHIARDKPVESLAGLATIAGGMVLYGLSPKKQVEEIGIGEASSAPMAEDHQIERRNDV